MTQRVKRLLTTAGLLATTLLLCGCEERSRRDVTPVPAPRDSAVDSREAGREVGEAARDAKENVDDFFGGMKEGYGGSGPAEPADRIPPADLPERARLK